MHLIRSAMVVAIAVVLACPFARVHAVDSDFPEVKSTDIGPCGEPPPPKPAQRSASEGLPPLPLPVVPQRRTEKKKPPEPPTLVVKIKHGPRWDWATDPNDINNLLLWMKARMKVAFGYEEKTIDEIDFEAERPPLLYRTGHNAFEFTPEQRAKLRKYVLDGGFIFFDACCGRKEMADSVRHELAQIFPERKLESLPPDHPVYRCYYDVPTVEYTPYANVKGKTPPPFEGIDVGCRTAVIFTPYDVSCGWDMHTHDTNSGIQAKYALQLGANMIAYATATKTMGESLASAREYVNEDQVKADRFRVGQIIHTGQWHPNVARLGTLLDTVGDTTSMKVRFGAEPVKLDSAQITELPFLYLTGHRRFELTDSEKKALRNYLEAGGFLFAEACCGRQSFDVAFRDTMKQVFPGKKLELLGPDHPIFAMHHKIGQVNFTQAALVQRDGLKNPANPQLYGLAVDGHLAVVYSPYGIGNGWELTPNPYAVCYESKDAIQLGVNIVLYAMTH